MLTSAKLDRLDADLGELVAARQRGAADGRRFTRYARDPVGFIRDVLGDDPWAKQEEVARLVRDHPLVAVRSANGVGKDWLAARLALWWVYARRGLVLLTGPTERQVLEILMKGEIARAFRRGRLPGELYATALRLPYAERAGILAFTSNESSKLTGFHDANIFAVITEAQGVEDFAFEAILSCAVGTEDRILAVGNPLRPVGRFYAISRPSSQWEKVRIAAAEHPNIIAGRTVIPGGVTQAWVARQRREWGAGSSTYIARVLGEFPESSEDGLVTRAWLEAAAARHESGALAVESQDAPWTAALDVARFGHDSSCLALRRGPVLASLVTWHGADTMATAGRTIAALRDRHLGPTDARFGPGVTDPNVTIIVDVIGIGSGVVDRLVEQHWPASPHNASARPRQKDRFLNRRAEAYWQLRTLLESDAIALPRDEELFEELLATRWLVGSNGKIAIEGKAELRARLGRSPDKADAVAMAFGGDAATASLGGGMVDL